ncbi:MAG: class I SAM-dependent methyltransferase [Acidobacteriaceae bacterium]
MSASAQVEGGTSHAPFDVLADCYDDLFTNSLIGRAQRKVTWGALRRAFNAGDSVLELNCGTGEDALFLAKSGVTVLALDISESMIAVAKRRKSREMPAATARFSVLPIERISELAGASFDGAFSNFSGLNCVRDLGAVALALSALIKPNGHVLLCLSTRVCAWEVIWFLVNRMPRRAFRRASRGCCEIQLGQSTLPVWYPLVRDLKRQFHPWFLLQKQTGVGVFVPPSYMEEQARRAPRLLRWASSVDELVCNLPVFRSLGDHVLLDFCRSDS